MVKKLLFSEFNQRIKFGDVKYVRNPNTGDNDEEFVPDFEMWCKPQKRTVNQSYSIYGTDLEGTIVVVIRHDNRVSSKLKAEYKGQTYDIVVTNPDETGAYMAYDYLTLRQVKKVG